MKKLIFLSFAILCLAGTNLEAYDGVLINRSQTSTADLVNLSNVDYGFSTARSSAMAGAFTSLGADLSSMSINPAGLGMYTSSEFAATYAGGYSKISNNTPGGYYDKNRSSNYDINNIGAVFNFSSISSSGLNSLSIGFGYNKLADFNSSYGVATQSDYSSITQIFAKQLGTSTDLGSNDKAFQKYGTNLWGGILAYQTEAVDPDGSGSYEVGDWYNNSLTTHYLNTVTSGYMSEYLMSMGFSLNDKVYIGASLGLQEVYYDQTMYYDESYTDDVVDLAYLLYDQRMVIEGAGINFKIGATIVPVDGLRIGVAVHTPTTIRLETTYSATMTAYYDDNDVVTKDSDTALSSLEYTTPTRLLAGISYVFAERAILSADYERVWYNQMSVESTNNYFADNFKAADNFRVGFEYLASKNLALRLGYAYYGDNVNSSDNVFSQPVAYKGYNISAGVGFNFGNSSIDLTYVRQSRCYTAFDFYYYSDGSETITSPNYITSQYSSDNISLGLSHRF